MREQYDANQNQFIEYRQCHANTILSWRDTNCDNTVFIISEVTEK